jgi:cytochrome c5
MLGRGLQDRVASADQAAQISQQCIEVGLDGLEQFCNRCHASSAVA